MKPYASEYSGIPPWIENPLNGEEPRAGFIFDAFRSSGNVT
jgi:hypothetical protein